MNALNPARQVALQRSRTKHRLRRIHRHRRLDHRRIRNLSLHRGPGGPGLTHRRVLGQDSGAVRHDHAGLRDRIALGPGHAADGRRF